MVLNVGLYARISDDAQGEALGVNRQEIDARQLAKLRGWTVVEAYVDNDFSAYRRGVVRPAFERMLDDVREGVISGVVVYDLDRFARQPRDLERAIDLFETRPGLKFATVQGDVDLSAPDGRTMARVMVAFANKSSADTSRRVARKALESAQKGIPVGMRAFGWSADKRTLDPAEAAQIRRGADALLSGVSLGALTDQWNAEGWRTSRDNAWQRQTMRHTYLSPRLAGLRPYKGDVLLGEDGKPIKGQWEPVLPVEQWTAVVAILTPEQRGQRPGGRRYLLSGLVRCGGCGRAMVGNRDPNKGGHAYSCKPPNQGGCGSCAVVGPKVDRLVELAIVARLDDLTTATRTEFAGRDELLDKRQRIADLMVAFTKGDLSAAVVFPSVQSLERDIAALRAQERSHAPVVQTTTRDEWGSLEVARQREIVASKVGAVLIRPSTKRGGRFDPQRVEIAWR